MFGIDIYAFSTLWPSLLGIAGMSIAMTWGCFKVAALIKQDTNKKS